MATERLSTDGYILLGLVILFSFLYQGPIFGWPPIQLILEDEGQYSEISESDRSTYFTLIFTVSVTAMQIQGVLCGAFVDKFGPKWTTLLSGTLIVTGLTLFALSDSSDFDFFLPSYVMIALGGTFCLFASLPVSFLLPRYQHVILSTMNCLFDSSSLVFLLFYEVYRATNVTRRDLFLFYALLAMILHPIVIFLWARHEKKLYKSAPTTETDTELTGLADPEAPPSHTDHLPELDITDTVEPVNVTSSDNSTGSSKQDYETGVSELPVMQQIRSVPFIFITMFMTIHLPRINLYLGSLVELIEFHADGDKEVAEFYVRIISYVFPLGIFGIPIFAFFLEKYGFRATFYMTAITGLAYGYGALIPSLPLQILVALMFTVHRAFLFSTVASYMAFVFGIRSVGRVQGICFSLSAASTLLIYPAADLTHKYLDGNPMVAILFFTTALAVFLPIIRKVVTTRTPVNEKELNTIPRTPSPRPSAEFVDDSDEEIIN